MNLNISLIPFVVLLIIMSGCATSAQINYQSHSAFSADNAGNQQFEEIGPVSASVSNFYGTCQGVAERAMARLDTNARALGGDAIIRVRFLDDDGRMNTTPTCEQHYWPFFLLIPVAWMHADIEGVAVKLIQ